MVSLPDFCTAMFQMGPMVAASVLSASQQPLPGSPVAISPPERQTVPLVFASPHSGNDYPADFIRASRLDPLTLRRSEDAFVDELFASVPGHGAPLLRALFPRVFCDPNREPYELDQDMFTDTLPPEVNTSSPRVAGGLGTIARIVTAGAEIYRGKLTFAEARERIETHWRPYHAALLGLVEETKRTFGAAILIDCHSMPSVGGPLDRDPGVVRPDVVLGNRHGASCRAELIEHAAFTLRRQGLAVALNAPYAGAYTTQHYGRPYDSQHTLQIEINRALYMDEERLERGPGMAAVAETMSRLAVALGDLDIARFKAAA
jgi:N-formylglutamate amidohydrolase